MIDDNVTRLRWCRKCHSNKGIEEFIPRNNTIDGYSDFCRTCFIVRCRKCNTNKTATEFGLVLSNFNGLRTVCKECSNKYRRKHREKNKDKINAKKMEHWYKHHEKHKRRLRLRSKEVRAWKLNKCYGMTLEDFELMKRNQNGTCAICGNSPKDGRELHVDHDHKTNRVRGLLCGGCNRGIGMFKEDLNIIQRAIEYLKKEQEK